MILTIINELYYMMKLNVLWVLFTIMGLGVFGIGPATFALFTCLRRHVVYQEESHVFKAFKKAYFEAFQADNRWSVLLSYLLMVALGLNRFVVNPLVGSNSMLGKVSFVTAVFLLSLLLFLFPTSTHFALKGLQKIVQPFVFMVMSPLEWGLAILVVVVTTWLYANFPVFILFLGVALPAYAVTFILVKRFNKIVEKYDPTIKNPI